MRLTTLLLAAVSASLAAAQTDQSHPCYPLELIHARGSTEPSPLGTNLGPALKTELEALLGNDTILVVGLIYPATFDLPSSPETGIRNMIARIRARSAQCPDMKFAIGGYSQGCDVTHATLQSIPDLQQKIVALAMFGDPLTTVGFPPVYEGRVINCCDRRDRACGGRGISGHTAYGKTEVHGKAVAFIAERFRAGENPVPADTRATMKALPEPGDAAAFLSVLVTWPPSEWKTLYPDGWKPPVTY